jgi:flagellar FliL protein
MAEEEKKEEKPAEEASAAPAGGGKLVTILTLVNLLITVGVAAVLFITFKKDQKPSVDDIATTESHGEAAAGDGHGEKKAEGGHGGGHGEAGGKPEPTLNPNFGKMVTLEQFTVNLVTAGSSNPKFARVNISLELPGEDTEAEINHKMPKVRNAIIDLFNSKRPTDLSTPEGRTYLKDEIKNALNTFLITGKVKGVFFTNFALSS